MQTPWWEWTLSGIGTAGVLAVARRFITKTPPQAPAKNTLALQGPVSGTNLAVGDNARQEIHIHGATHREPLPKPRKCEPSPRDIIQKINSAMPFLRDSTAEAFEGVEVHWLARFSSARKEEVEDSDRWWIHCVIEESESPYLSVQFALSEPQPELKSAEKNQLLCVRGRIANAKYGSFFLRPDPEIELLHR